MATIARHEHTLQQRIIGGIVGGIAGGLVFGAMMGMMGMLSMVAGVVGSQSPLVGFVYHMFNSIVIGAIFGFAFGNQSHTFMQGILWVSCLLTPSACSIRLSSCSCPCSVTPWGTGSA